MSLSIASPSVHCVHAMIVLPKYLLGSATVMLTLYSFSAYFKDLYHGRTKPHAFSWLAWSLSSTIAFAGQWTEGGGAGSWSVSRVLNGVRVGTATRRKEHRNTGLDIACGNLTILGTVVDDENADALRRTDHTRRCAWILSNGTEKLLEAI